MVAVVVAVVVAALFALLASCSSEDSSGGSSAESRPGRSGAGSPVFGGAETAPPSPSPTGPCADGTCEIEVAVGDVLNVPETYGLGPIEVAAITGDSVEMVAPLTGSGFGIAGCSGGGGTSSRGGGGVTMKCGTGPAATINDAMSLKVAEIRKATAVLRIEPTGRGARGGPGPGCREPGSRPAAHSNTVAYANTVRYVNRVTKRLTRVERREQTRTDLVEAAIGLFAGHGVSSVSVEAVAEEAGYSRGAYHSNFSGRDELLDAVVQVVVSDLGAELRLRTEAEERALAKLSEYIRTFAAYCAREPGRTRALVAVVSYRTTAGGPDYDSMVDESLGDLIAIFEQGQEAGQMRCFDRVVMARLLRRALDGEAVRIAAEGPGGAIADEIVANFVHATRA